MRGSRREVCATLDYTLGEGDTALGIRDYGGAGRPVVLVHGLRTNAAAWDTVGPILAERLRVVALDLRGHGLSAVGPHPGWRALAGDVARAIAELRLPPPVLVGHSIGVAPLLIHAGSSPQWHACLALDWLPPSDLAAASRGWKNLAIHVREDPLFQFDGDRGEVVGLAGDLLSQMPVELGLDFAVTMLERELRLDGERWIHRRDALEMRRLYLGLADTAQLDVEWARIHQAGRRFQVVASRRSGAVPGQAPARGLVWTDAGHMIPWEAPELVVDQVVRLARA